jgi:hypothetical protein
MIKLFYPLILLFLISLFNNLAIAQSGIVHVGGDVFGSDGSVSFTIGQIDYLTVNGPDGSINPGIQQVYDDVGVGVSSTVRYIDLLKIYPNPNSGIFTLELLNEEQSSDITVEIYGIHGNLIKQTKLGSRNLHILDISDKPAGIYHLRAIKENKSTVIKIVKQ